MVSLMAKHEEGGEKAGERWTGERVDSEELQARPEGDPFQACLSSALRSGLAGQKQDC